MATEKEIEAAAKAAYFSQYSVMHDHDKLWAVFDKAWLYRDMAKAALAAAEQVRGSEVRLTAREEEGMHYLRHELALHEGPNARARNTPDLNVLINGGRAALKIIDRLIVPTLVGD